MPHETQNIGVGTATSTPHRSKTPLSGVSTVVAKLPQTSVKPSANPVFSYFSAEFVIIQASGSSACTSIDAENSSCSRSRPYPSRGSQGTPAAAYRAPKSMKAPLSLRLPREMGEEQVGVSQMINFTPRFFGTRRNFQGTSGRRTSP